MSTSGGAGGSDGGASAVALETVRERDREIQLLTHIEAQLRWDHREHLTRPIKGPDQRTSPASSGGLG